MNLNEYVENKNWPQEIIDMSIENSVKMFVSSPEYQTKQIFLGLDKKAQKEIEKNYPHLVI